MDSIRDVVRTVAGPVFTSPIRDALGTLPAVDLAVAYGVPSGRSDRELTVAALTVREGHELDAHSLSAALRSLPAFERPAVVHVVDSIPVTTWYRPLTRPLREAGIPEPDDARQAWYLDRGGKNYRPLSAAARKRLIVGPTGPPAPVRAGG
jgi:putative long chain acyl-CoA synthase